MGRLANKRKRTPPTAASVAETLAEYARKSRSRGTAQQVILQGDCINVLRHLPDCCVDLVVTSPPYADRRKTTYGGIHPDNYVEWFMPRADEIKRVLKPDGSFVLNIKEALQHVARGGHGRGWRLGRETGCPIDTLTVLP